ncbi:hypothetical protein TI05_16275 [Achromatium sp. WMS3]|nr:hypothetical protein TI05_16275 [Achromatium sp. WMS3]
MRLSKLVFALLLMFASTAYVLAAEADSPPPADAIPQESQAVQPLPPPYMQPPMRGCKGCGCKRMHKGRRHHARKMRRRQHKQKMMAMKMEHMKKIEQRLANIEALLQELVDLKKANAAK